MNSAETWPVGWVHSSSRKGTHRVYDSPFAPWSWEKHLLQACRSIVVASAGVGEVVPAGNSCWGTKDGHFECLPLESSLCTLFVPYIRSAWGG